MPKNIIAAIAMAPVAFVVAVYAVHLAAMVGG